jgi:hypothetical protein
MTPRNSDAAQALSAGYAKREPKWFSALTTEQKINWMMRRMDKAFSAAGCDCSKLFDGVVIEGLLSGDPEFVKLVDGEPLDILSARIAENLIGWPTVYVLNDENITGFVIKALDHLGGVQVKLFSSTHWNGGRAA